MSVWERGRGGNFILTVKDDHIFASFFEGSGPWLPPPVPTTLILVVADDIQMI